MVRRGQGVGGLPLSRMARIIGEKEKEEEKGREDMFESEEDKRE